MPIYNAENYLEDTINSIINQSIGFDNIELILIDDFSTDGSKKIIESYSNQYSNIVPFYSSKNHGHPGFGRNVGLEKATSEYIMFMDNDDELDKDICKLLYETIVAENADVVCCDTVIIDPISVKKRNADYGSGIEKENFIIITGDDIIYFRDMALWNKIYKKNIIYSNDIKFEENTYVDDLVFVVSYFLNSKKLIYLKDYFGYIYNSRSDSLSHDVKKEHVEEIITGINNLNNVFKKENKQEFANKILTDNTSFIMLQCSYLNENKSETEKILREFHDFEIKNNIYKLNYQWMNFINYFILREHYLVAMLLLKTLDKIRGFEILRKINRKIK